jgi:hypothetical protein
VGKHQPSEGAAYCTEKKTGFALQTNEKTGEVEEMQCTPTGVDCSGSKLKYTGHVWHDPSIEVPILGTNIYVCVNNGCPDEGAEIMKCQQGYEGALCAVCSDGFTKRLRDCVECETPSTADIALVVGGTAVALAVLVLVVRKYRQYFHFPAIWSHLKILVSFLVRDSFTRLYLVSLSILALELLVPILCPLRRRYALLSMLNSA